MNRAETGRLLTKAAMIDNREVTPALVAAWHELLEDVDYADAVQALKHHRATSTEYLVPAHILAGVRRIRADRLERSITTPPDLADGAVTACNRLQAQIKAIADGRYVNNVLGLPPGQRRPGPPPDEFAERRAAMPGALDPDGADTRRAALAVGCPHCQARPGKPCVLAGTRTPIAGRPAHDARIRAAETAQ